MQLIKTYRYGGERDGPHLLITGGVHGDEFESMAALRRLMRMLSEGTEAELNGRLTLAPVVNERAYLRGHRKADDDLDLARVCPGRADGSITEQVAAALTELIQAADFFIDLHTGGSTMSVLPMSGYSLHKNKEILNQQRRMARAFNLPVVWGTSGELDGRSLSVARDAGVPAIYTEYLGSGRCSIEGPDDYLRGCLNVMAELGMLDRPPPPSRIEHVVEDPRRQSGHMQICNPAPITGLFEPAVALGEEIVDGQPLGDIWDHHTDEARTVLTQQTGIILTLRTFSRVIEGDSLGVVLETHLGTID